jgi:hypothetical protein
MFLDHVRVTTMKRLDQDHLNPLLEHPVTYKSWPGIKPGVSCVAGAHSSEELAIRTAYLFAIRTSTQPIFRSAKNSGTLEWQQKIGKYPHWGDFLTSQGGLPNRCTIQHFWCSYLSNNQICHCIWIQSSNIGSEWFLKKFAFSHYILDLHLVNRPNVVALYFKKC